MATALHPSGLSSQSHQGVSARIFRRVGGAVRSALTGGITFAGRFRRPARRQSSIQPDHSVPPPFRRPRAPRRPRSTPPAAPARLGWFARWFGASRSRPAPSRRPRGNGNPFTPEAYPGLPPEAFAILNTPVEDCDPVILRLLFSALAQHLAESLPPEAEMTEAQKALSTLWGGLIAKLAAAGLEEASPAEPAATPADAAPDAPPDAARPPALRPGRQYRLPDRRQHRLLRFRWRGLLPRRSPDGVPPPRRLTYAACAGPP